VLSKQRFSHWIAEAYSSKGQGLPYGVNANSTWGFAEFWALFQELTFKRYLCYGVLDITAHFCEVLLLGCHYSRYGTQCAYGWDRGKSMDSAPCAIPTPGWASMGHLI
jgi:hypothetical protein